MCGIQSSDAVCVDGHENAEAVRGRCVFDYRMMLHDQGTSKW